LRIEYLLEGDRDDIQVKELSGVVAAGCPQPGSIGDGISRSVKLQEVFTSKSPRKIEM